MSKINKNFTLSVEIVDKLKQIDNASALIEGLLQQHFAFCGEKKKNLMEKVSFQLKNYSLEVKKLKKKAKILKEIESKGLDHFGIRWLLGQETEPSIEDAVKYLNSRELKIQTKDFIGFWEVIQQNVDIFSQA